MKLLTTISCILLLLLLLIVYYSKMKNVITKRKIFFNLIFTCIIVFIIRLIEIPIMTYIDNELIQKVIVKLTWTSSLFLIWIYYLYGVFYANSAKETTIFETIKLSKFSKLISILNIMFIIGMIFMPIGEINIDNYILPKTLFIYFLIDLTIISICIAIGIKMHWNELDSYKRNTLFIANILLPICIIPQYFINDFSIFELIITIIVYVFYFNVENPDLEIIEDKTNIKNELETSNNRMINILNILPNELDNHINNIKENYNKLINEENKEMYIKSIINTSYKISDIGNNVLSLSFENDNNINNKINYNFNELLQRLYNYSINRITNSRIKFEIKLENNVPSVLNGDYQKVYYIITNLLDLSINNIEAGKIILNISSTTKNNELTLNIKISDTSNGISKEALNILNNNFKYELLNNVYEYNLYLINSYIKLLDGNINVSTIEYGGNKIYFSIKQLIIDNTPTNINLNSNTIFDSQNKKVVIVNNNNIDNKLLELELKKYNCTIDIVKNLKELINKIKLDNEYDLIFINRESVLDKDLKIVKILEYLNKKVIPIVYISSNNVHKEIVKINEDGIKDIIFIPYDKVIINNLLLKYLK